MGDLEPEHRLVEVHGLVEVGHVDAVLIDARLHGFAFPADPHAGARLEHPRPMARSGGARVQWP
jgi:hypothetical protein